MQTSRTHILDQLAAGHISAQEAARQLQPKALQPGQPGWKLPPELASRWLRVRITDLYTQQAKVSVNLPLSWVAAGLKLGAQYAPSVASINIGELIEELKAGSSGRLVDIENHDDGERVEIFVD